VVDLQRTLWKEVQELEVPRCPLRKGKIELGKVERPDVHLPVGFWRKLALHQEP